MAQVTFSISGGVVLDMEMNGVSLPPSVHSTNQLNASAIVTCSEEEARAIEQWLRRQKEGPPAYRASAEVIRRTLDGLAK